MKLAFYFFLFISLHSCPLRADRVDLSSEDGLILTPQDELRDVLNQIRAEEERDEDDDAEEEDEDEPDSPRQSAYRLIAGILFFLGNMALSFNYQAAAPVTQYLVPEISGQCPHLFVHPFHREIPQFNVFPEAYQALFD